MPGATTARLVVCASEMPMFAPPVPVSGTVFEILQAAGAFCRGMISTFAQAGGWQCRRANGSNASKSQIVNNDQLFNMAGFGYHSGGDYSSIGRVLLQAFANDWPGRYANSSRAATAA